VNPWTIESIITHAKEMAERNGFELLPGEYNIIKIIATKPPYGRNVTIARLNDWESVELFFIGYEQAKMELDVLAKGKKAKPKEPEHIDSETCWCKPELDYTDPDTGVSVYVHRRTQ